MKFNKKYFQLDLDFGITQSIAFSKCDIVEGDGDNLREEVISQAINHGDIAVDDDEYVKTVTEITEEQYWTGKKAKNEEQ